MPLLTPSVWRRSALSAAILSALGLTVCGCSSDPIGSIDARIYLDSLKQHDLEGCKKTN